MAFVWRLEYTFLRHTAISNEILRFVKNCHLGSA